MADYGFVHDGKVFTPNGTTGIEPFDCEAYNAMIEAAELAAWHGQPERFAVYVTGDKVTTWQGKPLGYVIRSSEHRNNLGARIRSVTIKGNNGATYHGRYGSDWSQLVRLRRSK